MSDADKSSSAGRCDPVSLYAYGSLTMLATVLFGTVAVVGVTLFASPEKDRVKSLREATCVSHGMRLLSDKYHPAVCAFEVDEQGRRIFEKAVEVQPSAITPVPSPARNPRPF